MSKEFKTLVSVKLTMDDWKALIAGMAQMDKDTLHIVQNVGDQLTQAELDDYSYEKDYGLNWDTLAKDGDLNLWSDTGTYDIGVINDGHDYYVEGVQTQDDDVDDDEWNRVYWS